MENLTTLLLAFTLTEFNTTLVGVTSMTDGTTLSDTTSSIRTTFSDATTFTDSATYGDTTSTGGTTFGDGTAFTDGTTLNDNTTFRGGTTFGDGTDSLTGFTDDSTTFSDTTYKSGTTFQQFTTTLPGEVTTRPGSTSHLSTTNNVSTVTSVEPATSTTHLPDHDEFVFDSYPQRVFIAVVLLAASIIGTIGNTLVITSVIVAQKLRSVTNTFVFSLSIADLLVSLCLPWNAVALLAKDGWPLPDFVCSAAAGILLVCVGCSVYTLASIAVNRWMLITKSMQLCDKVFTRKIMFGWIALTWILSFIATIVPPLAGFGELGYNQKYSSCSSVSHGPRSNEYDILTAVLLYPISLLVIIVSYVKIFMHVRQHSVRIAKNKPVAANGTGDNSTSNTRYEQDQSCHETTTMSIMKDYSASSDSHVSDADVQELGRGDQSDEVTVLNRKRSEDDHSGGHGDDSTTDVLDVTNDYASGDDHPEDVEYRNQSLSDNNVALNAPTSDGVQFEGTEQVRPKTDISVVRNGHVSRLDNSEDKEHEDHSSSDRAITMNGNVSQDVKFEGIELDDNSARDIVIVLNSSTPGSVAESHVNNSYCKSASENYHEGTIPISEVTESVLREIDQTDECVAATGKKDRRNRGRAATIDDVLKHLTLPRLSNREIQITKNMFYIVVAFLVCFTPFTFCLFIDDSDHVIPYAGAIIFINSCINPIIYATKHPHFKKVFSLILRCRWRDISPPSACLRALIDKEGCCCCKHPDEFFA